jgi:hypothetical protein
MKIYIAGPMSLVDDFNRPAFHRAARQLTSNGHVVLNPAILPDGLEQKEYMDICFAMLRASDAILMLPDWRASAGACAEYHYAYKMRMKIFTPETLTAEKSALLPR